MNKIYIERHPSKYNRPKVIFNTLEELEEAQKIFRNSVGYKIWNADLSRLDFSSPKGQELLQRINEYDDTIIWPEDLKEKYEKRLQDGKYSGLGLSHVHNNGFTGKGVNIAIIDTPCYLEHPEYQENIKYYKEFGFQEFFQKYGFFLENGRSSYHGPAVASLAVGKTCGSAPEANLYFLATQDFGKSQDGKSILDPSARFAAIQHLIDLNNTLPESEKIRAVSCSWTIRDTPENYQKSVQLFEELEKTGCMVIGGSYKWACNTIGGSKIATDSDAYDNLKPIVSNYPRLTLPENQRTFASFCGGYMYTEIGGSSWTMPYLIGIIACGLQANPHYTKQKNWQEKIWQDLLDTARPIEGSAAKIIQPVAFIQKMLEHKQEREMLNQILLKKANGRQ